MFGAKPPRFWKPPRFFVNIRIAAITTRIVYKKEFIIRDLANVG